MSTTAADPAAPRPAAPPAAPAAEPPPPESFSLRGYVWRRLLTNRLAAAAFFVLVFLALVALTAPLLASDLPLFLYRDGHLSSPLLRVNRWPAAAQSVDRIFNFLLFSGLAALVLLPPVRLLRRALGERRAGGGLGLFLAGGLATVTALFLPAYYAAGAGGARFWSARLRPALSGAAESSLWHTAGLGLLGLLILLGLLLAGLVLLAGLLLLPGLLLRRSVRLFGRARPEERPEGRPGRWLVRLAPLLLGALAATAFMRTGRVINDPRDYRELRRQLRPGEFMLRPPVPWHPYSMSGDVLRPPSRAHLLGTDFVERDVLARLIHGTRVALAVGVVAVGIAILMGTFLGALAGYYRGWVDLLISRLIEIMICFPTFFLIITIAAFMSRNILNIMAVIGLTGWTGAARLVRGEVLRQNAADYVTAARAAGAGGLRIVFRHILPNAMAPVLVAATFGIAGAILTESGLSFLGYGTAPPQATWGELLNEARLHWQEGAWWLILFPGLAIFITVTCYNLVGETLRDATDPRLKT